MGRPAPTYWWDFADDCVIVQSDYPGGERLAALPLVDDNAESVIARAEELIADYRAGRKTPQWGIRAA